MKTISRYGVMVCVALACLHASAVFPINDFRKLYRDGARACVDFCITDDRGVPVDDAGSLFRSPNDANIEPKLDDKR